MIKCYAGYTKSQMIDKCSSGGIYPELALSFVKNGGVVYASVYDENFNVKFERITDCDNLEKTFGAKYAQSDLGLSFRKIRDDIKEKRDVLFCGLPCQVAGLKAYIESSKTDDEHLYTVDLFCHGEPTAIVWEKYFDQNLKDKSLVKMNMRSKDSGWKYYNYSFKYEFADKTETVHNGKEPYMQGYLENLYTKPMCCNCKYKSYSNVSDITLGDFWGVDRVHLEIDDKCGVSAVVVNTQKGVKLTDGIAEKPDVVLLDTTIENIMSYDNSYVRKVVFNPQKYKFLLEVQKTDNINALINDYIHPSKVRRYLNKAVKLKRMYIKDKKENKCLGCTACVSICPKNAVKLNRDRHGFLYPVISSDLCIKCKKCSQSCVIDNELLVK